MSLLEIMYLKIVNLLTNLWDWFMDFSYNNSVRLVGLSYCPCTLHDEGCSH